VSGLVVLVVSLTGCLYAFQEEILDATEPFRYVEPRPQTPLPPSRLQAIATRHLPGKHLHAVMYGRPDRAAQAIFYQFDPAYYFVVYLDPYTGAVLKVKDMDRDFFRIVLTGHFYLWLPPAIGQPVVASSTLVFVVLLLSGLVLWWPRNRAATRQRLGFRWKPQTQWKRRNYDLHTVLGFYACWLALVLALTGLVWGFSWFAEAVYRGAGGTGSTVYREPLSEAPAQRPAPTPAIDRLWHRLRAKFPRAYSLEVHIPETDRSAISININPDQGTLWKIDYRYFDQYSLRELPVKHVYGRFGTATAADKLIRLNYDVHVGAIGGLPGKVLAFLVSLTCASLPVTGFLVWWGRRRKAGRGEPVRPRLSAGPPAA